MDDTILITVLRALWHYEQVLTNQADDYRDPDEWDRVVYARNQLRNQLKNRAYL